MLSVDENINMLILCPRNKIARKFFTLINYSVDF